MRKYRVISKSLIFVLLTSLPLYANQLDRDLGLEEFQEILKMKLHSFKQSGTTDSYEQESSPSETSIVIPISDTKQDWNICNPEEAGELIACTYEGASNVSLAAFSAICNKDGTRYIFSECEIIDCDEGYTGEKCDQKNS